MEADKTTEHVDPMSSQATSPEEPKAFRLEDYEVGTLVRSKSSGMYQINGSKAWGKYLVKTSDPDGTDVSKKTVSNFSLNKNFSKIPADQWSRYISLCFYMCPANAKKLARFEHDSQLEVQVCLLRDRATLTKWKIVVPKQVVTGTHVDADLQKSVDLETGEEYTMFPPMGWLHAGSSHSHNTMAAFFSSTDDASEKSVPGLHIVVGSIDHEKMEYEFVASIVLQKNRKSVELDDVVETEPVPDCPFHDKVLDYISVVLEKNKTFKSKFFGPGSWASSNVWNMPKAQDPIEDDSGKLNGFYRFLDRNNSDLFDNMPEGVDLFSLSDSEKKAWFKEEVLTEELLRMAEDDSIHDEIMRDISRMESSE